MRVTLDCEDVSLSDSEVYPRQETDPSRLRTRLNCVTSGECTRKGTLFSPTLRGMNAHWSVQAVAMGGLLLVLSCGCSPKTISPLDTVNFRGFIDGPIPVQVEVWLQNGEQSGVTDNIREALHGITGRNRRELVFKGMDYIWSTFRYDRGLNDTMFINTAKDLFQKKILGGCADFALVELTVFRALGVPARMILTANCNWLKAYKQNPLSMPEGHSFIEVYLEDGWHLVDSTYRHIYSDYDSKNIFYPHEELFCDRGVDFWTMGITNNAELTTKLQICADQYEGIAYSEPNYSPQDI